VGLSEYEEQGYLPEAINNYLLRLGFGHGDDEIISRTQAIEWFDIHDVKKSPACLDFDKMLHLNAHYLRAKSNAELVELCREKLLEASTLSAEQLCLLAAGIGGVKLRARTLKELFDQTKFYVAPEPITISEEALVFVKNFDQNLLNRLCDELRLVDDWSETALKAATKKFMEENGLTMQTVAHVIRALTTGSTTSPGIFEVMRVLGKEKTLIRLAR
jgi:glutamyl-tRNA synthetase